MQILFLFETLKNIRTKKQKKKKKKKTVNSKEIKCKGEAVATLICKATCRFNMLKFRWDFPILAKVRAEKVK